MKRAEYKRTVFSDVRFMNEVGAIEDRGGQVFVVSRKGVGPGNQHSSESAIDFRQLNTISNDGTLEDLENEVKRCLGPG